jgi:hypothetical protein
MTERTPIQISGDRVLCDDGTLWKYDGVWWVKLTPIPTDDEYEVQQEKRLKWERQWMEAQTKQGGWSIK